jgi:multicomponent Na+:H+ antiporter subunit C
VTTFTAALVAALYGIGVYMILQRTLTKVILGLALLSHGANLLLLIVGGKAGLAPLIGSFTGDDTISDPVPPALVLTAIVISFGMTVFLLALAYRSWQLTRDDTVEDDAEDRRIAHLPHGRPRAAARPTRITDGVAGPGDTDHAAGRGGPR